MEGHPSPATDGLRRIVVQERIVALCTAHAAALLAADAKTLRALRRLFREEDGRRSLVPRRSPLDRRVFPPRPEGRRMSEGRRTDDSLD